MESKKRKRDADYPRITYRTPERTFDRLFKEESLWEIKEVVRRKLNLASSAVIQLAQLRAGTTVDLEDDDDFDAFYVLARSTPAVEVQVTVITNDCINGAFSADKRNGHRMGPAESTPIERDLTPRFMDASLTRNSPAEESSEPSMIPPSFKRKRRVSFADTLEVNQTQRKKHSGGVMQLKSSSNSLESPAEDELESSLRTPSTSGKVRRKKNKFQKGFFERELTRDGNTAQTPSAVDVSMSPSDEDELDAPVEKLAKKMRSNPSAAATPHKMTVSVPSSSGSRGDVGPATNQQSHSTEDSAFTTFTEQLRDSIIRTGTAQGEQGDGGPSVISSATIPFNNRVSREGRQSGPEHLDSASDGRVVKRSTGKTREEKNANGDVSEDMDAINDTATVTRKTKRARTTTPTDEDRGTPIKTAVSQLLVVDSPAPQASGSAIPERENDLARNSIESAVLPKHPTRKSRLSMSHGPDDMQESTSDEIEESSPPKRPMASGKSKFKLPWTPGDTLKRYIIADGRNKTTASQKLAQGRKRTSDLVPCPVCLQTPHHLRYQCPIIVAGPDSIKKRILELKQEDPSRSVQLIEELEHMMKPKRAQKSNVNADSSALSVPASQTQSTSSNQFPSASILKSTSVTSSKLLPNNHLPSRKPTVPPGLHTSDFAVDIPDEGARSEDSGNTSESEGSRNPSPQVSKATFPATSSYTNIDLDELIHGPPSSRPSQLSKILARVDAEEEEEEDQGAILEEEEDDTKFRRLSKKFQRSESSDDEAVNLSGADDGDDDTRSPSLIPSAEDGRAQEDHPAGFHAINGLRESQESDRRGDLALAADTVILTSAEEGGANTDVAPLVVNGETAFSSQKPPPREKQGISSNGTEDEQGQVHKLLELEDPTEAPTAPADRDNGIEHATDTTPANNERLQSPRRKSEIKENLPKHYEDDPIEPADDSEKQPQRDRCSTPVPSTSNGGLLKRMKDKSGRVSTTEADLLMLTTDGGGEKTVAETPGREPGLTKRTRNRSASVIPQPPPTAKRPLGRPRKTDEEKALAAAQKLAQKEEKARLKEEEKARLKKEKERLKEEKAREKEKLKEEKEREQEKARLKEEKEKEQEKARLEEEEIAQLKEKMRLKEEEKAQLKEKMRLKEEEKARLEEERMQREKTGKKSARTRRPSVPAEPATSALGRALSTLTPIQTDSRPPRSPASQPKWAALTQSSPTPTPDLDFSDQLQRSSPRHEDSTEAALSKDRGDNDPTGKGAAVRNPLFMLTESQVPFPYSQQEDSLPQNDQPGTRPDESESEDEEATRKKLKFKRPRTSSYRKLTDIASQQGLFPAPTFKLTPASRTVTRNKIHVTDDEEEEEEEEEDTDDSGSDSDEEKSHIPEARRAGRV